MLFRVNCLRKYNVIPEKGCQWFSIRSKFLLTILNYENISIFEHSLLVDETYLQTILYDYISQIILRIVIPSWQLGYID